MPKYNIPVQLLGEDGNAMVLISKVRRALVKASVREDEVNKFMTEAMSGDYNKVIQTCMEWVDVR